MAHGVGGARPQAFQEQQPPELAAGGEHRVAGGLERAVSVEQPRPARPGPRVRVHERDQCLQRAGMDLGVGVEQQHVAPLRQREPLVVGPRKADILGVLDQPHPREPLAHHRRAAVGRGVVDDEGFSGTGDRGQGSDPRLPTSDS